VTTALATATRIEAMPSSPVHIDPVLKVVKKAASVFRTARLHAMRLALLNLLG
jgi:hypothetical protein